MAKFDDNEINKFIENLESVDETWQSEYNLKEVIEKAYSLIEKARKYKVSWGKIANLLEDSCDNNIEISPVTIRQYFLEISKKPKRGKKRLKSRKNKVSNQDINSPEKKKGDDSKMNKNTIDNDSSDDNADVDKDNKRVMPSAFNLRNN